MIAYVQQLAKDLVPRLTRRQEVDLEDLAGRFAVLAEELDRLDPRDFVVAAQFEFVNVRRETRSLAQVPQGRWMSMALDLGLVAARQERLANEFAEFENQRGAGAVQTSALAGKAREMQREVQDATTLLTDLSDVFENAVKVCENVVRLLDLYAGGGSRAVTRSFKFVQNSDLRDLLERDYKELSLILLPGGAWKSAVVLAGSILEAILHDLLTHDAARTAAAMAAPRAPKKKSGAVKDITMDTAKDEWQLVNLIEVAVDLRLLPQDRADTIDQVLRDYRNFVHPKEELKAAHPCTEAEATLAKGALDAVCNHLGP
jgi:hypothetical protein